VTGARKGIAMEERKASVQIRQNVRWLPADMDTPISLFMGMAREGCGILLESAEVDGRWGRYSVLACDMALVVHCEGGRLQCHIADERLAPLAELAGRPFVEGLRELMRRIEIVPDEKSSDLPPITRSLCGYFGFGMAGLFEAKLVPFLPPEEAECVLCLPGTMMLFDHLYNRLAQVSLGEHRPAVSGHDSLRMGGEEHLFHNEQVLCEPEKEGYKAMVGAALNMLCAGEAIRVVPSARFSMPFHGDALQLYRRMRSNSASPYMFFMRLPQITLFGSSPEVMVRCSGGHLLSAPIAGTRHRGRNVEEDEALAADLLADPKERAEHMLLVDMARSDLGRVACPGTVDVGRLMRVERFSHVMQMTSRVTAELREGLDAVDVLAATFPAGTVSGAPRIRAMEVVAALEQRSRGPYAGCIGWLGLDKDSVHMDTGIAIRTMWVREGMLSWQAGGSIGFDSDAEQVWKDVMGKAAVLRDVCTPSGDQHVPAHR